MSFFFGKSDSSDNLQYDDTASLHFAISVCIITTITFAALIYRDVKGQKKQDLAAVKNMSGFKQKIANTEKTKKNYFKTFQFLYKFGVIVACIVFGIYCYSNIRQDSKMIGFDPYEILGVSMDAEINTIKKAYRKLALQFHPDRNVNNPEAAAKFIQISKAYQCLTDEQAKQKCKKYGNPDGETSFKVGIGLPRFMVDMQNQYFILIPIFIIILVVIPRAFIKWSNRIKPMDDNGNLLVNYGMFTSYITPAMNPITFSVIFGSMKQLDAVFPESTSKLDPQLQAGMKALLVNCRAVTPQQLQTIPQHVIFRICTVYSHMANRQRSQKLVQVIPDLCRKIIMFSLNFAQKSKDQQMLYNNPNWALTYYGFYPVELAIFFSKQMFNPSIRLGDTRSIEFLDLTPEEQLMAKNIPIGNLQYNLLWDDEKINNLSLNFSQERQQYIKKQIDNLPALKVQSKVLLGDEQVSQMTVDDFAILQVKVIRKKPTPGFVQSKDYPMLAKEQFYIAICYNQNVILFRTVNFKQGSNEAVFKCQHRQSFIRQMKFDIIVLSNCYPNMDLREELVLNVTGRVQNRKVQIHKDDLNIQKFPKSFIQSLASMDAYNQSDKQLSEGSDNEEQDNSEQKKKQQKGGFQQEEQQEQEQGEEQGHSHSHQQSGGCCDHEHGQKVQTGFKQETN